VNYIDAHRTYNTKPRPDFLDPPAPGGVELLNRLIDEVMPGTNPVPEELARQVIDQYDTGIANLDEQVGKLLDRLDHDRTVIVVTSDHGEYFGEHLLVEHSKDVYQEALRVPLIVRGAGQRAGRTDDTLTVSQDLPGMIVAELPEDLRQRLSPLFPHTPGSRLVISENYYTRAKDLNHPVWGSRFQRIRQAVFDWPYKLIHSSDGKHELYDLEQDPREQNNLIDERPEVVARLRSGLQELEKERAVLPEGPDLSPLDDDLRRRLEELGYVEKQED
jgi:arylsulfatase A-like enzyme